MPRSSAQIVPAIGCRLSRSTRELLTLCRKREAALAEASRPWRSHTPATVDGVLHVALKSYARSLRQRLRLAGIDPCEIDEPNSPGPAGDGHRGPPVRLPGPRID